MAETVVYKLPEWFVVTNTAKLIPHIYHFFNYYNYIFKVQTLKTNKQMRSKKTPLNLFVTRC